MKRKILFLFLFMATVMWGRDFPKFLYGVASWYGEEFAGRRTASGAIYDPNLYTAAHRTLPFGTLVEIENLENGRKVEVTINDRGPFVDNRIIDVSKRAAEDLGFLQRGTAFVKVAIIRLGNNATTNVAPLLTTDAPPPTFPVQNRAPVLTNYITNTHVVTNFTNVSSPRAIVVPFRDTIIERPRADPSFILDEPERIFVPAISRRATNTNALPQRVDTPPTPLETNRVPLPPEPQIIFSDVLLPEERVIPLQPAPITNQDRHRAVVQEEIRVNDPEPLRAGERYVIQVGAFTRRENALRLYQQLRNMQLNTFTSEIVVNNRRFIRVRVGYYASRDEAQVALNRLFAQQLNPILLRVPQ